MTINKTLFWNEINKVLDKIINYLIKGYLTKNDYYFWYEQLNGLKKVVQPNTNHLQEFNWMKKQVLTHKDYYEI